MSHKKVAHLSARLFIEKWTQVNDTHVNLKVVSTSFYWTTDILFKHSTVSLNATFNSIAKLCSDALEHISVFCGFPENMSYKILCVHETSEASFMNLLLYITPEVEIKRVEVGGSRRPSEVRFVWDQFVTKSALQSELRLFWFFTVPWIFHSFLEDSLEG